jgi:predicted ribonuclease YlaK
VYTGYRFEVLTNEQLEDLAKNKLDLGMQVNEYLIVLDEKGEVIDRKRWNGTSFERLQYYKTKTFFPLTPKQECAFDLLNNPNIPIRILGGCAGSGKTRIAMFYAFHFLKEQKFNKIFVVRHNVSVGEKNGFLPGSKVEKIKGWLGFFEDNLDDTQDSIDDLILMGKLEVDCVESMKGRDLKNSFILIDEAEDLTEEQFKMIGERVSKGSVICFVGDYEQVTQEKYSKSSGLLRALSTLKGNPKVGIVVFDDKEKDNVRSEVSKVFTYQY